MMIHLTIDEAKDLQFGLARDEINHIKKKLNILIKNQKQRTSHQTENHNDNDTQEVDDSPHTVDEIIELFLGKKSKLALLMEEKLGLIDVTYLY